MENLKTIEDFDVCSKYVLVRLDLNVPIVGGQIIDQTRIQMSLPTLQHLIKNGARIIVLSHLGRPKGKAKKQMSLKPVALALEKHLNKTVIFSSDCVGAMTKKLAAQMHDGEVLVLENLRFYAEEEQNCPFFSKKLADLGDIFVNDAFSCSHRTHASILGITNYIESCAGLSMKSEVKALSNALDHANKPLGAIIGGSKVSTKMEALNHLVSTVDKLIIGGGMANTFLLAKKIAIGSSIYEKNMIQKARETIKLAAREDCEIILPIDAVVSKELMSNAPNRVCQINSIPNNNMILDIGPRSCQQIVSHLNECKTIFWNGPLGAFEFKPFDMGTNVIAKRVAELTINNNLLSVAGGGDTVAALQKTGFLETFSYVSSGGGAFLEWLEGNNLPGIQALKLNS